MRSEVLEGGFSAKTKLTFDTVAEYCFDSTSDLDESFGEAAGRKVFSFGPEAFGYRASLVFVTNEVILYDRAVMA